MSEIKELCQENKIRYLVQRVLFNNEQYPGLMIENDKRECYDCKHVRDCSVARGLGVYAHPQHNDIASTDHGVREGKKEA